jgi:hypothetical protein
MRRYASGRVSTSRQLVSLFRVELEQDRVAAEPVSYEPGGASAGEGIEYCSVDGAACEYARLNELGGKRGVVRCCEGVHGEIVITRPPGAEKARRTVSAIDARTDLKTVPSMMKSSRSSASIGW